MSRPRPEHYAQPFYVDVEHLPVDWQHDRDEQDENSHIEEQPVLRRLTADPIDLTLRPF